MTELRALSDAATPGPWTLTTGEAWPGQADVGVYLEEIRSPNDPHAPLCLGHGYDDYGHIEVSDAAFIVAAVNYVRAMLETAPSDQPD